MSGYETIQRSGRHVDVGGRVEHDILVDADGQPGPLMRHVLRTWPSDLSAWQRAFRMVSPNERLDGGLPHETLRTGDRNAIEAAENAGRMPIG